MSHIVNSNKLKKKIAERGKNHGQVAEMIGIARTTFQRKLKNGGFSVKEVNKMMEVIPLSRQEASVIFFGVSLADMREEKERSLEKEKENERN